MRTSDDIEGTVRDLLEESEVDLPLDLVLEIVRVESEFCEATEVAYQKVKQLIEKAVMEGEAT